MIFSSSLFLDMIFWSLPRMILLGCAFMNEELLVVLLMILESFSCAPAMSILHFAVKQNVISSCFGFLFPQMRKSS